MKIEDIDFILSHFSHQKELFPRKIMTFGSNGQYEVQSKEELFEKYQRSNFIDCRINGYPVYTEYRGIIRHPPNFVFIDLDLANFDYDKKKLSNVLARTLKKMREYRGFPTVLWTANGYHIYQPIDAIVLDQESIFSKDNFPNLFSITGKYSNWSVSEVFLKFAEIFFTNNKADPLHKPKYKTCLIRIHGTFNSKNIHRGASKEDSLVKVIQKWDGNRIPIQYLLKDFRSWIFQEEYDQKIANNKRKQLRPSKRLYKDRRWINNLIQTPLEDHRKYCLLHILAPYLVNVKELTPEAASYVIIEWLSKCNTLKSLDFDPKAETRNRIKYVRNFKPMSLAKLHQDNNDLYNRLTT